MKYILIADNDKIVANTLKNLIEEKMGYKCIVVKSKKECEEALCRCKGEFELALLDVVLPDDPDGKIVDEVVSLNIPTILLTKTTEREKEFREKDVVDYIVKTGPFSIYHALTITQQIIRNKSIKVLVADSSHVCQTQVADLLKNYKLNVFTAKDGEEAMSIIEEHDDIKIVLTDFMLPKIDGIKLIRTLRRKYNRNEMAIIVVSSETEKYIPSKCLKSGANDFILKGFDNEEFYARLNANLESIALYDDLKNETLARQNRENVLLDESKMATIEELLHNISHHWRQPLNIISTSAGSLRVSREMGVDNLDAELESLDNIVGLTQDLSKTIEMFKEFFSFQSETDEFDITSTLKEYANLIASPLKEQEIDLVINCNEVVNYNANKENFVQVMMNLINNSKEILQKSQGDKKIILIDITSGKDGVELNIKDSGGGVPENIMHKIFEPYFSTQEERNGTGLGLFIARKIVVNEFNGTIGIENRNFDHMDMQCYGANFRINLPPV